MDDPTELLDLVDQHDQPIGTIVREDIYKIIDGTIHGYVRAAGGFVMNRQGKVWIPRRRPEKKICPNALDFSADEHVGAGETYAQAIVRGTAEELGLQITESDIELLGTNQPAHKLPYFHGIFLIRANDVPQYSKKDFGSFEWLTPQELHHRIKTGELVKDSLPPAVELLAKRFR